MSELDLRHIAEKWVEQFHIFDLEWRDALIDQYVEILQSANKAPEYIRPIKTGDLPVLNIS